MLLFIIFLSIAAACCTSGNNKPAFADSVKHEISMVRTDTPAIPVTTISITTNIAVAIIRTAFQKINSAQLKKQVFKWTAENCDNEGNATYYLDDNNQIIKMVETVIIGNGS